MSYFIYRILQVLPIVLICFVSCRSSQSLSDTLNEADAIRRIERERLRALVEANVDLASQLHADDFQLINPLGFTLSKEQYLGGIANGSIDYTVWEADSIQVRLHQQMANIRYQSNLEIIVGGQKSPMRRYWHTDCYEKRNGKWQVVWSQATQVQ